MCLDWLVTRPVNLPADGEVGTFGQFADFELHVVVGRLLPAIARGVAPEMLIKRLSLLERIQ